MPTTGELLADRYRILGPIGAGGMATVHRAHDERLGRDVAIKTLLPNHAGDPALAARFEREARTMAAGAHPGVVSVYDVDPGDPSTGRAPFFVMELCAGGSLADRLRDGRRLPPDELVPVLVSVAEGLADLHTRGIVHRDVKPSNILFASHRAKLADFGIARSDGSDLSELTTPGTAVGTLAYLAPEVLAGESATAAADVHALGVAAFAGLTGTFPRPARSLADLIASARMPVPRVSATAPDLGTAFDEPIAAALHADPARRPDALTLATRLTAALGHWRRAGAPGVVGELPPAATVAIDATTVAIPAGSDGGAAPPGARESRVQRGGLPPAVAGLVVVAVALVVGALASGIVRTGAPGVTTVPRASGTAGPSPSALLTASPRGTTTPSVAERALAALAEVDAAIGATTGRGGLKGNERSELEDLAGNVRAALDQGDLGAARRAAATLADRADEVGDELDEDRARRLIASAEALVEILNEA